MFLMEHSNTIYAEHTDELFQTVLTRLKPVEYFRRVKAQLRAGKQKEAFSLLQQAIIHFPNDPVLLSYYGCLMVLVEKKYRMGIEICLKAIDKLKTKESFDEAAFYAVFYYNLGKAYAAAGKRKEALDALKKGLSYDQWNSDIINEMRRMGTRRRKPPIPFLERSNPLNIIIGVMLHNKKGSHVMPKKSCSEIRSIFSFPKFRYLIRFR